MKKALGIFLALSLVTGVFAADPVADLNLATFNGWASVTFGVDLDTEKTGFKNETGVSLQLNFLPESTNSTAGSGIWGELVVKLDGDIDIEVDDKVSGTKPSLETAELIIDKAQINFGDAYLGIKTGDFDFGGDFKYPNAMGYDNGDSAKFGADSPAKAFNYQQGLMLGYANDMFKVEASIRTKLEPTGSKIESFGTEFYAAEVTVDFETNVFYAPTPLTGSTVTFNDNKWTLKGLVTRYVVDTSDSDFWTGHYALGLYAEVKPIKDLMLGVGVAYGISGDSDELNVIVTPPGVIPLFTDFARKGDLSLFAGAEYKMAIGDTFSIEPVVTYNFYSDAEDVHGNELKDEAKITQNKLGLGLNFGWGEMIDDGDSVLYDFFKTDLPYIKADEGDAKQLPGISVFTSLDLMEKAMDTNLPLLVMVYSGDIAPVPGLKAMGVFYANVAKDAPNKLSAVDENGLRVAGATDFATAAAGGLKEGVQFGLAASYEIMVGDITITPAAGLLYQMTALKDLNGNDLLTASASAILPDLKVDIAGLVDNTTFTVAWADAKFLTAEGKDDLTSVKNHNGWTDGEFTVKMKIAL